MFPKAGRIKIQAITPSSLFPTLLATRNRQTFSIRSINQAATSQQDFGVAERQGNARRSTNHYFLAGFSWKGLEASNLTSDSGSAELVRMCVHKISIYLSVCLSVCLCLSICLSICLSVYLSVYLAIYVSVCLSVCLSACLPACLPVCLSVCLPFYGAWLSFRAQPVRRGHRKKELSYR